METQTICKALGALSHEGRLKIFRILVEHSQNGIAPTEIAVLMNDMPMSTLSFHLSLMTKAHLCHTKKSGKQIIYLPECAFVKNITLYLLQKCCSCQGRLTI